MPDISQMVLLQQLGNLGAAPSAARNWDFAYTWNNGATTFVQDFVNVTDTASAAGSLLIDRQVGGASKFSVSKAGVMTLAGRIDMIVGLPGYGLTYDSGLLLNIGGAQNLGMRTVGFASGTGVGYLFASGTTVSGAPTFDTGAHRNSAGVWEFNNGTKGKVRGFQGGGAAVASAAALPLPTGSVFHVTGTTGITSITSTNFQSGVQITLIFDGALTVTDGGNLKLAGNFTTTADGTLTLVYDGTNWYEVCRSIN